MEVTDASHNRTDQLKGDDEDFSLDRECVKCDVDGNAELSQWVQRVLNQPTIFNLDALTIVPGKSRWRLNVDVRVQSGDLESGALLDRTFFVVREALLSTLVPQIQVDADDFDVVDDVQAMQNLPVSPEQLPVCITLYQLGNRFIVDATTLEAFCSEAALTVAVNPKTSQVVSMQKSGLGSIQPSIITEMIQTARKVAQNYA